MTLNFSNCNSLWTSVLVETLSRLGLTTAVICPGSRSAPLAVAFAQHPTIEAIPVLDERSAAFFALGLARRSGLPVALVCTSGTAGANFFPALIEARESRIPLLVLTADRPPELRHCNAGQTIDQQKLFGSFPNWYAELALPEANLTLLAYVRQTLIQAWERACYPVPGPVHLNLPFREPLAPVPDASVQALTETFPADFFASIQPSVASAIAPTFPLPHLTALLEQWQQCPRGVIIAGLAQPADPKAYCHAIAHLAKILGWPVLAEALSPLRNYASLNPSLITTYDLILRQPDLAEQLVPSLVIRFGEMPTSKELRAWLQAHSPQQWVIDPGDRNLDPLHNPTTHLRLSLEQLTAQLPPTLPAPSPYLAAWCQTETQVRAQITDLMQSTPAIVESKVAWLLSQHLPPDTPLFVASSMPVRDMEWFWVPGDRAIVPYFNRGANGIDGTLSTALGIAHHNRPSVLLTGDLALLHDTNGFLLRSHFQGHLTILVINNQGGGIFEMLPIAPFNPPFEEFFATPQHVDFAQLCAAYNLPHQRVHTWDELIAALNPLPPQGIRLLELHSNRKHDAQWRKHHLDHLARIPAPYPSANPGPKIDKT